MSRWATWSKDGVEFVAPLLLRYEVVNAFYQLTKQGGIESTSAEASIKSLVHLPIELMTEESLHWHAFLIASRFRIRAAYDAHYVALAQHLDAELWTADKRLYNSVHPHLDFVHLIDQAQEGAAG
jgi:predicted nucleic acid-binding protein